MFNSKTFAALMILMVVLVAGSAMAETTLYGRVHASLDMQNNGDESVFALNSNSSRIGWKGYSKLNENFTAIWKIETAYNLNDSGSRGLNVSPSNPSDFSSGWTARDTYGGVKGTWGKVKAGHFGTPMKQLGSATTFFMDQVGDRRQLTMGKDMRYHSQVSFELPKMDNGIGGSASVVLPQNEDTWYDANAKSATAFFVAANYSGEAFMIGVAFDNHSEGNYEVTVENPEPTSETTIRVAGNYRGNAFGLNALYQGTSNVMGFDGLSASVMNLEAKFKASDSFHIKAGYTIIDPNTDSESKDDGASLITIGLDHPISEDVTFYLQYAMITNDDNAQYGLNSRGGSGWGGSIDGAIGGTLLAPTYANPCDFSLGMIHNF